MSGKDWEDLLVFVAAMLAYMVPIGVLWWLAEGEPEDEPYCEPTFDELLDAHPELDDLSSLTAKERDE